MNNFKELLLTVAVSAVVSVLTVSSVGLVSNQLGASGIGQSHYQVENFLQGLYAGTTGQFKVSNAGRITASGLANSSGTTIGGTATQNTWNYLWTVTSTAQNGTTTAIVLAVFPSTTSTASTTIDVTGLTAGKITVGNTCSATLNTTSTAPLLTSCRITSVATTTASTTVTYLNVGPAYTIPTSSVVRLEFRN